MTVAGTVIARVAGAGTVVASATAGAEIAVGTAVVIVEGITAEGGGVEALVGAVIKQ
jgi:hypothetical protein